MGFTGCSGLYQASESMPRMLSAGAWNSSEANAANWLTGFAMMEVEGAIVPLLSQLPGRRTAANIPVERDRTAVAGTEPAGPVDDRTARLRRRSRLNCWLRHIYRVRDIIWTVQPRVEPGKPRRSLAASLELSFPQVAARLADVVPTRVAHGLRPRPVLLAEVAWIKFHLVNTPKCAPGACSRNASMPQKNRMRPSSFS